MNQVSIYRQKKIMNSGKKKLSSSEIIEFKLLRWEKFIQPIKISHVSPTYTQSIFSLRLLQHHSPLSARVAHALGLANKRAPHVPLADKFNMLNVFNISLLHISSQHNSTHHCSMSTCWKFHSTLLLHMV